MGVLTIPLSEVEELNISEIMKKHNIATKTGAMRYSANEVLKLQAEIASLKKDKAKLQAELYDYYNNSKSLVSALSSLMKLTEKK